MLRLRNTEPQYALYDVILRCAFASTMLFYVFAYDVTRILLVFVVFEVLWGGLQLLAYLNRRAVPGLLVEAGGFDAK